LTQHEGLQRTELEVVCRAGFDERLGELKICKARMVIERYQALRSLDTS